MVKREKVEDGKVKGGGRKLSMENEELRM